MKNSTILVVGTLGLVGAYLYLKRKQAPMINEIVDNSLGLSTSLTSPTTDTNATTTTTSPTTDTNATTTTTSPTTDTNATTTTIIPIVPPTTTIIPIVPPTTTIAPIAPIVPITYIITPTTPTPSVADVSLGLNPKPIIEIKTELSSPNYIEAQILASKIKGISSILPKTNGYYTLSQGKALSDYYGRVVGEETNCQGFSQDGSGKVWSYKPLADLGKTWVCNDYVLSISKEDMIKNMTAKINALGYKVLPNYDIEKM